MSAINPSSRINPLLLKGFRARVRLKHMLSWGVITVAVTAFISLMTYLTMTEREMSTREDAAMAVLPGVIVIQAIVLMMFGTGAVASGVASEREDGLLDYVRMTPMSPTSKILGYLFGLPVREYILFALTVPFVVIAVIISGFSVLTLLHFYAVFFTSVWIYHLTGMVAGMISQKPRLASMMSMGLVAVLYFVLPNLSRIGITFFEFLTIRPTFFGLLQQEMPESMRGTAEASGIDSFRDVPFFSGLVHPTLYTLLVQGFMLAVMFSVVHRRWRDQASHIFSKVGALLVFSGVLAFLVGSVWAIVVSDDAYRQVFAQFGGVGGNRSPESIEWLLFTSLMIVGGTLLLLMNCTTPTRHTAVEGWRRARKIGRKRISLNADGASSLPLTLVMIALTLGVGGLLLWIVSQEHQYFSGPPSALSVGVLGISIVGVGLFAQGVRERMGVLVFGVGLFLLWVIPFFAMMIMLAAFEAHVPGAYVGLPCPPVILFLATGQMLETTTPLDGVNPSYLLLPELAENAGAITLTGAVGYAVAAGVAQAVRWVRWRSIRSDIEAPGAQPLAPGPSLD